MPCSLVARGCQFDVRAFTASSPLPIGSDDLWQRGLPRSVGRRAPEDSGFSIHITKQENWKNMDGQIDEAVCFLKGSRAELAELMVFPGVESVMLEFALDVRVGTDGVAIQGEYLPPDLLRMAGELGIGIGLSLYPPLVENGED